MRDIQFLYKLCRRGYHVLDVFAFERLKHKYPVISFRFSDLFAIQLPPAPQAFRSFWYLRLSAAVTRKSLENFTWIEVVCLLSWSVTNKSIPVSLKGIHTLSFSPFWSVRFCSLCEPTRYSPARMVNRGCILSLEILFAKMETSFPNLATTGRPK